MKLFFPGMNLLQKTDGNMDVSFLSFPMYFQWVNGFPFFLGYLLRFPYHPTLDQSLSHDWLENFLVAILKKSLLVASLPVCRDLPLSISESSSYLYVSLKIKICLSAVSNCSTSIILAVNLFLLLYHINKVHIYFFSI